jgi:hypothetical protein
MSIIRFIGHIFCPSLHCYILSPINLVNLTKFDLHQITDLYLEQRQYTPLE